MTFPHTERAPETSIELLRHSRVLRVSCLVTVAVLGLVACSGRPSPSVPFVISPDARGILADWQSAGLGCGPPEVGEPGPAVAWYCRRMLAGLALSAGLTVDRHGVQTIVAGTPRDVDRRTAARAFAGLLGVTSELEPVRAQIAAWLLARDAADGWMPPTPGVGLVHVEADDQGSIDLYLVPADSSIMSVSPDPTG